MKFRPLTEQELLESIYGWLVGAVRALASRTERLLPIAAAFAVPVAVAIALAARPGIPSFQQDWSWPTSLRELYALHDTLDARWVWHGLGYPQVYAFSNGLNWLIFLLCRAVGVKGALVALVFLVLLVAGLGAQRLAKVVGAESAMAQIAATISYQCSPVVYNKIVAGHTYYWIGLALLPWLLLLFFDVRDRVTFLRATLLGALLLTLSWSQAQFIVFDGIVLLVCVAVRRSWLVGGATSLALAVAAISQAYPLAALAVPQRGYFLAFQRATLAGVASESVKLSQFLRQTGYPPGYFTNAYAQRPEFSAVPQAWLLLGISACVCIVAATLLLRYRRDLATVLALTLAFGFVLTRGTLPPFGAALTWFFENLRAFSILKELYHSMVLAALPMSVGFSIAVDLAFIYAMPALNRRSMASVAVVAASGVLVATLVIAAVPMVSGTFANQIGFTTSTNLSALLGYFESGGVSRVLIEPAMPPILDRGRSAGGGNDPTAYQPWNQSSVFEPVPEPRVALAETELAFGSPATIGPVLASMGVQYVVVRKAFKSAIAMQADLPEPEGELLTTAHTIKQLQQSGMQLAGNQDDLEWWRYRGQAGLFELGGAPALGSGGGDSGILVSLLTGSPQGNPLIYPDDVRNLLATHVPFVRDNSADHSTVLESLLVPFSVDIARNARDFDPRRDWAPVQNSFYFGAWLNTYPQGALVEMGRFPLHVVPLRGRSPYRLLIIAGTDGLPLKSVEIVSGTGAATFATYGLTDLETHDPARFYSLYAVNHEFTSPAPIDLYFDPGPSGVAVARIFSVPASVLPELREKATAIYRSAVPAAPQSIIKSNDSFSIASATPDHFVLRYTMSSRLTCSLTFKTDFDPEWVASVDGRRRSLPHLREQGWANAWIIPCGSHTIRVDFPDRFFLKWTFLDRLLLAVLPVLVVLLEVFHLVILRIAARAPGSLELPSRETG